jgi:glycosyltransferase involved in cell wall biosynthesis
LLVPPGDAAALAGAMESLLRDRSRAEAMATAGWERVQTRFSVQRQVLMMQTLYREVSRRYAASLRSSRCTSLGPAV